jgi:hypothetical protein
MIRMLRPSFEWPSVGLNGPQTNALGRRVSLFAILFQGKTVCQPANTFPTVQTSELRNLERTHRTIWRGTQDSRSTLVPYFQQHLIPHHWLQANDIVLGEDSSLPAVVKVQVEERLPRPPDGGIDDGRPLFQILKPCHRAVRDHLLDLEFREGLRQGGLDVRRSCKEQTLIRNCFTKPLRSMSYYRLRSDERLAGEMRFWNLRSEMGEGPGSFVRSSYTPDRLLMQSH